MKFERFEEILRWKYDRGIHNFIGNLSGNKYSIQNSSGRRCGYSLFINGTAARQGSFFSITCEIWDRESEVAGVKER